jgi:hypothetical protein
MDDLKRRFADFEVEKTDRFASRIFRISPNSKNNYPWILII